MTPAERKARIESLRTLVANHAARGRTRDARCLAALEELARLKPGALAFDASFQAIRAAAAGRRFITYGEVAGASGVPWTRARRLINRHLDDLCVWAHAKGWPLITAIVVEQENRVTGRLGDAALAGFLKAARLAGVLVTADERGFLQQQQAATFAWAAAAETSA